MHTADLYNSAIGLLKNLIETPSFSREEDKTATIINDFFTRAGVATDRHLNNVWAFNRHYDPSKPTVLLNSHHDTVRPNVQYTRDPFSAIEEDGKLYGLGSNDAGGSLVSLIATFLHFFERSDLSHNIVLAATAEEEISGVNGIECILSKLPQISFAIVGEPTFTNLAIAEKGLLVLDCTATGKAGHAAREEGENAITKAMKDINWFNSFKFPKVSECLGPVKMSVTVINTENKAHNVVPASCTFVVDIRVTDLYTHEEILETVRQHISSEVKPRSMRMRSSRIDLWHPLIQAGLTMRKTTYGSPTTSDQALIPAVSLKCGPGDSARSHSADEYIYLEEIKEGIETYIGLLEKTIVVK